MLENIVFMSFSYLFLTSSHTPYLVCTIFDSKRNFIFNEI